jgi:hypothetical protein
MKKSLQQNEGHLPLVPYCTNQSSEHLYAFLSSPTDCIELICLCTQISQQNLNIIIRMKPKQCLRKYDDMYSQLQIL